MKRFVFIASFLLLSQPASASFTCLQYEDIGAYLDCQSRESRLKKLERKVRELERERMDYLSPSRSIVRPHFLY